MDEALKAKILADIERSGFGSEMTALKIFNDNGWAARSGYSYQDAELEKTRDVDIIAHLSRAGKKGSVFYQIIAEVKKSETPWIVFKGHTPWGFMDRWQNMYVEASCNYSTSLVGEALHNNSLYHKNGWLGSGIHQAFKSPDAVARWYSAFVSVCKAGESSLQANRSDDERQPYFFMVKPLVIVDGILIKAEISDLGSIEVVEVNAATFDFKFRGKGYDRHAYSVDLVTINGLGDYLEMARERHADICNLILPPEKDSI